MTTFAKEGDEILLSVAAGQTANVTLEWTGSDGRMMVHLRDADNNNNIHSWPVNDNNPSHQFSYAAEAAQNLRLFADHVAGRDASCEATLALAP